MKREPFTTQFNYPETRQDDVVDNYHGTLVADPYRWLEDAESPETKAWVSAQNELTQSLLAQSPVREQIKERLTEIWNYPKYSTPMRRGSRIFFSKNNGLQNQAVIYWQESFTDKPKLLLDPNLIVEDGTAAMTSSAISPDGNYFAYGISQSGSDWQEIRVREVATGQDFAERLERCRYSTIVWREDNAGFYYNRFSEPDDVRKEEQYQQLYWHQLDTPQSADLLQFECRGQPSWVLNLAKSSDGQYLVVHIWQGTDSQNRLYYRRMWDDNPFVRLLDRADAQYLFVDGVDGRFYLHTDLHAPTGRVMAIDLAQPEPEFWQEIVPASNDPISFVSTVNHELLVVYLHHAHHEIKRFSLKGTRLGEVELPALGAIVGLSAELEDEEMFLSFSSFLFPTTVYKFDFVDNKLQPIYIPELDFDLQGYETKQVFYQSKDGTTVPMFLTHKKGLALDGANPTILYGYGGFKVNMLPQFYVARTVWLEAGGIFAVANLRGGDEYGEDWHTAGMLENKQTVFDDFISAGEWLIDQKYTSSAKLAIAGGSNGGLLVAACMMQRPDLFGAVHCGVPVIDMLRYHKFTIGKYWVGEYGNAEENEADFNWLYAYSPLHNLVDGESYPATLITTADTDDRVVPAHANKFAATLQAKDSGQNPIILRVETKAGHGLGKPTSKIIEEQADIYAFLWLVMGMA